ncbi:MAG: collagen-like protein, partial [Magnetococcales bacterium]|nr:collagen-like protein [Magnetococcales bacterium]
METPDIIVTKARPFFLNYFRKLATDLNTLTGSPVVCTLGDIALVRGEDELMPFFEADRTVAFALEDGAHTGDVHLVFDVATSVALAGLMMMVPEGVIKTQVKDREYNEEIQEGFQEVSNQVVGALNDLVEKKLPGGHAFLESTFYTDYGEIPKTMQDYTTYLAVGLEIQVSSFPAQNGYYLVSRSLADQLFSVEIPVTQEELDAQEAAKAGKGGGKKKGKGGKTDKAAAKGKTKDGQASGDGAGEAKGAGADGTTGGAPGAAGMDGAAGIPGAEGFDGGADPQGMGGAAGIPGAEGFDGGAAPQGMGGAAGIPGAEGFDGGAAPQGMGGAAGIPGADGFDGGA